MTEQNVIYQFEMIEENQQHEQVTPSKFVVSFYNHPAILTGNTVAFRIDHVNVNDDTREVVIHGNIDSAGRIHTRFAQDGAIFTGISTFQLFANVMAMTQQILLDIMPDTTFLQSQTMYESNTNPRFTEVVPYCGPLVGVQEVGQGEPEPTQIKIYVD